MRAGIFVISVLLGLLICSLDTKPSLSQERGASVEDLIKILGDPDVKQSTRKEAVLELSRKGKLLQGKAEAIPLLRPFLYARTDTEEMAYAIDCLSAIGKSGVPELMKFIQEKTDTSQIPHALEALGRIGPDAKAAAPALLKIGLSVPGKKGRDYAPEALTALRAIGSPTPEKDAPRLIKLIPVAYNREGIFVLGYRYRTSSAATALLATMKSDGKAAIPSWKAELAEQDIKGRFSLVDEKLRVIAMIEALGQFGSEAESALPLIRKFLESNYTDVQDAAESSIKKIKAAIAK